MADWIDLYFPMLLGGDHNSLEVTTDDTLSPGDPVYIKGNNLVGKADAQSSRTAAVVGIVKEGYFAGDQFVEVITSGMCKGVLFGAVAGAKYYLQSGGGISTALPGSGCRILMVGLSLNGDDLTVQINDYGQRP